MIHYLKNELTETALGKLPEKIGVFYFSDGTHVLFADKTANLRRTVTAFVQSAETNSKVKAMLDACEFMEMETKETLLDALVWKKRVITGSMPLLQQKIRPHDDYCYLAINFDQHPFVQIAENIHKADCYVGPFRSRFFLHDTIDIISEILHLPNCPSEEYPCERLEDTRCNGYCLQSEHAKLQHLLIQTYLMPSTVLINVLDKEYQALFDDLQFEQADKVRWQMVQLRRYYDYLHYFLIARRLDAEFEHQGLFYTVRQGQLVSITDEQGNKEILATEPEIEYRDSEFLALPKSQMDENWILYQHIKEYDPTILDTYYRKYLEESVSLYSKQ